MNRLLVCLSCLLALLTGPAWSRDAPQLQLPRVTLTAGMHLIQAPGAAPAGQCFWMKNTLLPLTAAFVADDGTIVNLVDMKPQSLDSHCSARPVRYVLEVHQGWFAKRGIQAGSRLSGAPFDGRK